MREYILTSPLITGFLKFAFDENARLVKFENNAVLTDRQWQFLYHPDNFPLWDNRLPALAGNQGHIEEVSEITFEKFWEEYGYKKGRINSIKEWNKLSIDDRAKAIGRIKDYRYDCKSHNREQV